MIDSVAAKVADDFFKSFEMLMQKQHAAELPTDPLRSQSEGGESQPQRSGISAAWRIALTVGIAAVALVAWYFFGK